MNGRRGVSCIPAFNGLHNGLAFVEMGRRRGVVQESNRAYYIGFGLWAVVFALCRWFRLIPSWLYRGATGLFLLGMALAIGVGFQGRLDRLLQRVAPELSEQMGNFFLVRGGRKQRELGRQLKALPETEDLWDDLFIVDGLMLLCVLSVFFCG